MTVSSNDIVSGPYVGNGHSVLFPFDFTCFAATDIRVTLTEVATGGYTVLSYLTHYGVTLNPDQSTSPGGAVSYGGAAPMESTHTLTIESALPYQQLTELPVGGNYNARVVEHALDALSLQIKQLLVEVEAFPPLSADASQLRADLADTSSNLLGAALVGYDSTLNYPAGTVGAAIGGGGAASVSMINSGADGAGIVDCKTVLDAVFAALPAGGTILFDSGYTFKLSTSLLNGKACTIVADGAIINCTSNSGALNKTDHAGKLTIVGGDWRGVTVGTPLRYEASPSVAMINDLVVERAKFSAASAYCVYLIGTRESSFSQCEFTCSVAGATGGVYMTEAVCPSFHQCQFIGQGVGTAVFMDGGGSPFSANPALTDCGILGWDIGVRFVGCDNFHLNDCTIDYNKTYNTYLSSVDTGTISGGYLGGGIDGISNVPAIVITSEGNTGWDLEVSRHILISGVNFTNHQTVGTLMDIMRITGPDASHYSGFININNCVFAGYTRYGINFATKSQLLITNSIFVSLGTATEPTSSPVYNALGAYDSLVFIVDNHFPNPTTLAGSNLSLARLLDNGGMVQWDANQSVPRYLDRYSASAGPNIIGRRALGAFGAGTQVTAAGTQCLSLGAMAMDDAATFKIVASITMQSDAGITAAVQSGRILLNTVPPYGGGASLTPVLELDSGGNVCVNSSGNFTSPKPGILMHGSSNTTTTGIFSGAGAPTITAANGSIYLRTDPTGKTDCLYVRYGGAWYAVNGIA